MSGYFGETGTTSGVPGELTLARVVLIGAGIAQVIVIIWGVTMQGGDAQWFGEALGISVVTLAGAAFGLLMRRGRAWIRWAATAVGAIWCVPIGSYIVTLGPSYLSRLLLPAVVIVAMHLPAARRYFAKGA